MPREFSIPTAYRSDIIGSIKKRRAEEDKRKVDFSPSVVETGRVTFKIARFFGFCYGVENAIEIAYRAVEENPGKRIFLVSEMIHNPHVNRDLESRGVRFLMTTRGEVLFPLDQLEPDDVVIVPAFGSTLELLERLAELGVNPVQYDATCPFVEKVWKRGSQLGAAGYTIVIHGKYTHEETRATLSRIRRAGPAIVVLNRDEARLLCDYIRGDKPLATFERDFGTRTSEGFDSERHLGRLGVINQTTMLAEETHEIGEMINAALVARYGEAEVGDAFADTRDTLCYATSENQRAMRGLVKADGDVALVVGGYNSSNTSHLVEIAEPVLPTFYIQDPDEIISKSRIRHLDMAKGTVVETNDWLPVNKERISVLVSAGASCPDALVEAVVRRVSSFF